MGELIQMGGYRWVGTSGWIQVGGYKWVDTGGRVQLG